MSGKNQIVFWLEGTAVKNGVLLSWRWKNCENAVACVLTPYGNTVEVWAEDIYLNHGAAMKDLAKLAGI